MTDTPPENPDPADSDNKSGVLNDRLPYSELRIAVLSDALQYRNGVDAYYRDLVKHLAPQVKSIALLTPNPSDGDLRLPLLRLPLPGDATQSIYFPHPGKLGARLRELSPNVLVSATNGPFGMYGVYLSYRHKLKLIAGFHTDIEELCDMYWGWLRGWITRTYMESQNRILFHRAGNVVVNSHSMMKQARAATDTPVSLMGTPLDSLFLEHPVSMPGDRLTRVFYGGRLAPEKNIDAVIDAARRLRHIHFTIAGDGPLRAAIDAEAASLDNLTVLGLVPRDDMVAQIDAHDLIVLPSHLEAFGTIALEAMVRQRLVLVSDQCGILSWQNLARGLYSYTPAETLADALIRIETIDPALRQNMARQAREEALASHQQAIRGWLELLALEGQIAPNAAQD